MNLIIYLLILVGYYASFWKLFQLAGRKPWEGIVPFYNFYVWLVIIKKPWWWLLLLILPGINVLMIAIMSVNLATVFNQRTLKDSLGSIFIPFIYFPYLAYKAEPKYVGQIDRKKVKKSVTKEWGDAIIFAIIAASIIRTYFLEAFTIPTSSMEKSMLIGDYLFVSKAHYGPKLPNTPLSIPFFHHTIAGTNIPSYLEWISLPYYRLPGFTDIERNDVVVFNFPEGDTVVQGNEKESYYSQIRSTANKAKIDALRAGLKPQPDKVYFDLAKKAIDNNNVILIRPLDKRENYIKRCVALPGDVLEINNTTLYINGEEAYQPEHMQYDYLVPNNLSLNGELLKSQYNINFQDFETASEYAVQLGYYELPMTKEAVTKMEATFGAQVGGIPMKIDSNVNVQGGFRPIDYRIFPNDVNYAWTEDNFGPLTIPEQGATVDLTIDNLPIYRRIIEVYEGHSLKVQGNKILIDGAEATQYTFGMNYYFMMGDNRHQSADSRYWGFVPEDHVVGKAVFIWLSLDPERDLFDGKIRWDRIFRFVE